MPAPGMDNLSWPTLDKDFSMEQLQQFSFFLPQHASYRAPTKDSAKTWANLVRTQLGFYHAEQTRPEFGTDRCGACRATAAAPRRDVVRRVTILHNHKAPRGGMARSAALCYATQCHAALCCAAQWCVLCGTSRCTGSTGTWSSPRTAACKRRGPAC